MLISFLSVFSEMQRACLAAYSVFITEYGDFILTLLTFIPS